MHKIEMMPQWPTATAPAAAAPASSHVNFALPSDFIAAILAKFSVRSSRAENNDGKRLQRLGERGGYNSRYNKKINLDLQQQQQQQAYKDSSNNNIMMNSGNVMGSNNNDFNTIMNVSTCVGGEMV